MSHVNKRMKRPNARNYLLNRYKAQKPILRLCLFLLVLFCPLAEAIANDAKVLVIVPNAFIREAIVRRLQMEGYHNIVQESCQDIDTSSGQIEHLFAKSNPNFVIVDGTGSSATDALLIDTQVIQAAVENNVSKLITLASFDVYPPNSPLPLNEDTLQKLKLEQIDDPWRIAKVCALKMCEKHNGLKRPNFLFCTFPYLCGPHDSDFSVRSKHPLKNMTSRLVQAKVEKRDFTVISNDGRARYELMHVDDLAAAVVYLLNTPSDEMIINIGLGADTNIKLLAEYVKGYLKYPGEVIFDCTSYDDVPRLVLNTRRLEALGWQPASTTQEAVKDSVLWLETKATESDLINQSPFTLP